MNATVDPAAPGCHYLLMRLCRLFAWLLATLTALFITLELLDSELPTLPLGVLAAALVLLAAGGMLARRGRRWLLAPAVGGYVVAVTGALLTIDRQEGSLLLRVGLAALLLLGVALFLRTLYLVTKPRAVHYRNYYDQSD